jgi:hypothetical protein
VMTVLVGASTKGATPSTSLVEAQALRNEINPALSSGGVAIPERHTRRGDEHLRLLTKGSRRNNVQSLWRVARQQAVVPVAVEVVSDQG